ncbi:MAG TPA: glutathione S-transferase N-terminal domain-containing protein, partial [Minicystis sp.]|nr:glutathione S-transferase N-terminal domain-containing protein [Minicystis sp.]
MTELFGLPISPWTEKARFALDHHGVAYRYRIYVPMLGEPLLRARLRRPVGRVTVPVLFTDEGAFADSFAIARYADRVGAGAPLVPSERAADVAAWNDRSEAALAAGRALTLGR